MKSSRWQSENLNIFIFVFVLINTLSAFAGPSRTTYQAKIIKPDGYPLEASSVNFKFTLLDPGGTCILFSETYSAVNMNSSGGLVSFSLGSGVKTYPVSSPTFEDVFSNITPFMSCDAGGPVSYSPQSSDIRKIVMQFHDGSGWQTLPAMNINAVPYAMYATSAETFGGVSASAYVRDTEIPSCPGQAISYNGTSFSCVSAGSGSVSAAAVISALGYTPADSASFTTVSTNLSSFQSAVAASFTNLVSSQIISLNGLVSGSQTFAFSNSGSAPNVSSSGTVHTFNFPFASVAATTAGVISNSDYSLFSTVVSKMTSSAVSIAQVLGFTPADQTVVTTLSSTVGLVSSTLATTNSNLAATNTNVAAVSSALVTTNANLATTNANVIAVSASLATTNSNLAATNANVAAVSSALATTNANIMTVSATVNSLANSTAASFSAMTSSQWISSGTTINYGAGFVGIGISNPTAPLHVISNSSNIIGQFQTASGTDTTSVDFFAYPADYPSAYLQDTGMIYAAGDTKNLQLTAVSSTGSIRFTASGYSSTGFEKMRINSAGVGVGETNPSAHLHVRAGSAVYPAFKLTSGTLLSAPQSGTIEYDGYQLYYTDGSNTRYRLAGTATPGYYDSVSILANAGGNIALYPNSGNGVVTVSSTVASTNSQTGALVVKGGVGVAGNIYSSGLIVTSSNVQGADLIATSSTITPYIFGSTVSGGSLRVDSTTHVSKGNILLAQSGGKVGIGTTSPNLVLDVSGSTVIRANSIGAGLWSLSNSVTGGRGGLIHTQIAPENAVSGTSGYKEYATSTGSANGIYRLAFIPDLSNPDSVVDRITITAAGNTGFGVTPAAKLHVNGDIQTNAVSNTIYSNNFNIYSSAADMNMFYSSADLNFNSDTVSAVTFKRSGYVGIGTNNPLVKLTVDDTAGAVSSTYAPSTDKLVVMSNGNGVINITTPNTAAGGIYFSDPQSRDAGGIAYSHLTDAMSFRVNNSNLMSINASGALTVGTGTSNQKLTVRGASVVGSASQTNISAYVNGGINLAGTVSNLSQEAITYASGGGGGAALAFRRGGSYETFMDFYTNNAVSAGAIKRQMVLSNLGNLGIGTDSPVYKFEVNDNGGYLRSETNDGGLELGSSNDESSYVDFHGNNNLSADFSGRIEYKDTFGFGFAAGGLAAPALTIVSSTGHVGIGLGYAANYADLYINSNTPSGYTRVVNANAAAGGIAWTWYSSSTGSPLGANRMCFGTGACILTLNSNGDGSLAGVFTHASDARLKRDISSITDSLDAITKLNGVTYYWIDPEKSQKKQVGLIAQEVEKVFPELVATDAQGFKSVAYQNLVAPIINAIKEIREWMFKTDERVLALEKENAELKQRLENLEKSVYQNK